MDVVRNLFRRRQWKYLEEVGGVNLLGYDYHICVLDAITYRLFRLLYKIKNEEEENGFAIAAKRLAQHFYRARISTRLNAIR
jgi:hypothetical protein